MYEKSFGCALALNSETCLLLLAVGMTHAVGYIVNAGEHTRELVR